MGTIQTDRVGVCQPQDAIHRHVGPNRVQHNRHFVLRQAVFPPPGTADTIGIGGPESRGPNQNQTRHEQWTQVPSQPDGMHVTVCFMLVSGGSMSKTQAVMD